MFSTDLMTNIINNYITVFSTIMPSLLAGKDLTNGDGLRFVGAGLAILGVFGAGIGQGNVGAGACMAMGRNPEIAGKITVTMIISSGIAESGAIYALVVAILILFVG